MTASTKPPIKHTPGLIAFPDRFAWVLIPLVRAALSRKRLLDPRDVGDEVPMFERVRPWIPWLDALLRTRVDVVDCGNIAIIPAVVFRTMKFYLRLRKGKTMPRFNDTANRSFGLRGAVRFLAGSMALAGLLTVGLGAQADDYHDGQVAVGGVEVLTIRFPAGKMTIKQRADAVTDRLTNILSDPHLKAADIVAVALGKTAAKIMVKDQLLITVDQQTAKANQSKPIDLAWSWVAHLRKVLPTLNVKPNPSNGETGDTK